MNKPNDPNKPLENTGATNGTRRPYRKPVLRSTDAFEKLALQTCAASETPDDDCPME